MKRKTKFQKETEAKAALRQRIADIYAGACGELADTEDFFLTLDSASRAITAMKKVFGEEESYMWESHCLDRFETVNNATDFLFKNGVRAYANQNQIRRKNALS